MIDTYWAAEETDRAVAAIDERVEDYYRYVQSGSSKGSLLHLWRASNRACFSGYYTAGEIGAAGKQGEYRTVEINEYGNLHQHLVTMVTAQRPTFEARTETVDAAAQQQAPVGIAVVETAFREKGGEDIALKVADTMIRSGEGWAFKRWDQTAGPIYSAEPEVDGSGAPVLDESGQPQMRSVTAGDVGFVAYHPLDVARDVTRPAEEQSWYVARRKANRWDLAAEYPDAKDEILKAPGIIETSLQRPLLIPPEYYGVNRDSHDDVWVYDFFHADTPALPGGRMLSYVSTTAVLFDGPLPYSKIPLYRCAAKEMEGGAFGYSILWDILAPQLALNNVLSHITTLASQLGAVVWEPEGMGQSPTRWKGILTILRGGTVPPQVLDLMKIPDALFKLVEFYVSAMERLSGINSVYRGQAQEGQRSLSGAAYALFAARAIEFGSRFQGAYAKFLEEIASGVIRDYQEKGRGEYLISMAGEGNAYRVQAFLGGQTEPGVDTTAARIHRISKMVVKLSNPLQSTQAGRMQMFESLRAVPGAITTPETALQVLTTGRLEPATQSTQRELENIAKENERLSKGEAAVALITDREWLHIPEHSAVAASPESRDVPEVVDAIRAHIEEHMANLKGKDPSLLAMQGAPPGLLQILTLPPAPPPMPGGPPPPPPGGVDLPPPPVTGAAEVPNQPRMPTDPLTGQQAPTPAGLPQ